MTVRGEPLLSSPEEWKKWDGRVDGKFPLGHRLGGSEHSRFSYCAAIGIFCSPIRGANAMNSTVQVDLRSWSIWSSGDRVDRDNARPSRG